MPHFWGGSRSALAVASLGFYVASGCSVGLTVPDDTQIECEGSSDCPPGWICQENLCVQTLENAPPVVSIATPTRQIDTITLAVEVVDLEGEALTLEAEVDGGAGWQGADAIAITQGGVDTALSGSPDGTDYDVTLTVAALLAAAQPTDPDAATRYRAALPVRLRVSDASAAGSWTETAVPFGNDAPFIESAVFDGDGSGEISGLAVLRIQVRDSASDPVRIEAFQLDTGSGYEAAGVIDPASTGATGSFPSGSLSQLATSPTGEPVIEHSFVWNSERDAPVDSPASIQLRVADPWSRSAFLEIPNLTLNNGNTLPVVTIVDISPDITAGAVDNNITVTYQLTDGDLDACRVQVDVFDPRDAGTPTEWRQAISGSQTTGLLPGEYSFVWNSGGQFPGLFLSGVRLRFTAYDPTATADSSVTPNETATAAFDLDNTLVVGNAIPQVTFEAGVTRVPMGPASIDFTIFDENDGDMVSLTNLEYCELTMTVNCDQDIQFSPLTPDTPSQLTNLMVAGGEAAGSFDWTASNNLGNASYRASLVIRGTPEDGEDTGPVRQIDQSFSYGNDPPTMTNLRLDFEMGPPLAIGNMVVRVDLADSSGDNVFIASFRVDPDVTSEDVMSLGPMGIFPSGSTGPLPMAPNGSTVPFSFVWNSNASHPLSRDDNLIAIQIEDEFGASPTPVELESTVSFRIQNTNESPTVTITTATPMQGAMDTVTLNYDLSDPENDRLNIRAQYSIDGGTNFFPASTDSPVFDLTPGAGNVFVWNAAQLPPITHSDVVVRLEAFDGSNLPASDVTASFMLDLTGNNASPFVDVVGLVPTTDTPRAITSAEILYKVFDGDGHDVTFQPTFDPQDGGGAINIGMPITVTATPIGVDVMVPWNLAAEMKLNPANVDVCDAAGDVSEQTIASTTGITISGTASDQLGKPGTVTPFVTIVGNTEPTFQTPPTVPTVSEGDINLTTQLADTESDRVRIDMRFKPMGAPEMLFTRGCILNTGSSMNDGYTIIPTSVDPVVAIAIWRSCAAPVNGGVGTTSNAYDVEIRVVEEGSSAVSWTELRATSEWQSLGVFNVDNTMPNVCNGITNCMLTGGEVCQPPP